MRRVKAPTADTVMRKCSRSSGGLAMEKTRDSGQCRDGS